MVNRYLVEVADGPRRIRALAFNVDGSQFAVGSRDQTRAFTLDCSGVSADGNSDILRYDMLTLSELVAFTAANRYARPLACGEQALYGLDQATPCS